MRENKSWKTSSKEIGPCIFGGASLSGQGGGYGFGEISETDALYLLEYCFERGIIAFDTAPIYGFGEAEKRLGKFSKRHQDKIFLISKSGVHWHSTKRVDMTNDPEVTKKMLEQSLRDLKREYIDLYMVHWPDSRVDIRKTMEVYAQAKEQGKILSVGLCNTTIKEIELAKEIIDIDVIQSELNLFNRNSFYEVQEFLEREKKDFISWGTLDKGILSGRVDEVRTFDKSDCRSWAPWWKQGHQLEKKFKQMKELSRFAINEETSLLSLAIWHNLNLSEVSSVIVGGKTQKQWEEILNVLEQPISVAVTERAWELLHE